MTISDPRWPKTVSRTVYKGWRDENGTYRRTEVGDETVQYQVDISVGMLTEMVRKAAHNRSGKSKDGPLTVYITVRGPIKPKEGM